MADALLHHSVDTRDIGGGSRQGAARRARGRRVLGLVVATSLLAGCALLHEPPGQAGERGLAARSPIDEQLRRQTQELELKLARSHLAVLEREAQIQALQEKLDLATQEVVRAMAKLRGLESKPEAASNLAEAEIALRSLENNPGQGRDQDVQQAKQLMKMAIEEFKKQNYGGTLYLTGQVKMLSTGAASRASRNGSPPQLEGEVGFSSPLPLKALATSNVRQGPSLNHKVAFVVETGHPLTGHAQKDLWVRVTRPEGDSGWIFYKLVGPR